MATKRVYLLRHAKSSWDDSALDDHERPLNKRGKRDAPLMGQRMRERGYVPDRIVSSTAVRAYTTARVIARELRYPLESIIRTDELYLADPDVLLACIRGTPDALGSLMLVGHNPGLTDVANSLTGVRVDNVPTCGLYCADFAVDRWRDLEPGGGTFIRFEFPKKATD